MATAQELLDIARGELGTRESPAGSNRVKYAAWYGLDGQPWCVMFVMWVFAQAGVALPARTASCTLLMRAAQTAGRWVTSGYQRGDVVIYDWSGDGRPDHCGIVSAVLSGGVRAIEGNTAVGNDSDGGEVMRRTRKNQQILGAVRPAYDKEVIMDNTPAPYAAEAVAWAVENGILQGDETGDLKLSEPLTRQQACVLLHRLWQTEQRGRQEGISAMGD